MLKDIIQIPVQQNHGSILNVTKRDTLVVYAVAKWQTLEEQDETPNNTLSAEGENSLELGFIAKVDKESENTLIVKLVEGKTLDFEVDSGVVKQSCM